MIARRLELVDVDGQRVARFRAVDVKRAGLRIVVAGRNQLGWELIGLGHCAVVAVFAPRDDARSRFDVKFRRRPAKCIR